MVTENGGVTGGNEDPNNPNNQEQQPLKALHFVLGDGVEKVTFGGSRDLRVDGNELDNVIIGNDGNNIINGKSGNDVILGGDGDDIINGGKGDDFIDGQVGMDKVYGHRGNDTLVATGSDNGTTDSNQNDFLSGGSGDDTIIDAANKTDAEVLILGGSGKDTFALGAAVHDLNYADGAPVEFPDYAERVANTKIADLTAADSIVLSGVTSDGDSSLLDFSPETGSLVTVDQDIATIDLSDNKISGLSITVDSDNTVAAPTLNLNGSITVHYLVIKKLSILQLIRLVANTLVQNIFDGNATEDGAVDHYGISDTLTWLAEKIAIRILSRLILRRCSMRI